MLAKVDRVLAPLMWIAAALTVILLLVGPALIGADKKSTYSATAQANAAAAPDGKAVFAKSGCGGCHTLKAAGATGAVGPNLDDAKPSPSAVEAIVKSGAGSMPSFSSRLSAGEIKAVAAFVSGTEPAAAATATASASATATGNAGKVTATIPAGRGPDGITVDDEGGFVYVADARAGRLVKVDVDDDKLAGNPIPAGGQPDSPAVADGIVWLVSSADNAVRRIEENSSAEAIAVGRAPESLVVGDKLVWVTNAGDGTVTRLDRDSAEPLGQPIKVGTRPLDIDLGGDVVWVTNFGDDDVVRIDAASGRLVGDPIAVGHHPRGIAVGEKSVWVANAGDGTVTQIDRASGNVVGDAIPVGKDPREIAAGEGGVWVANAADDTVTRIDAATGKVVGEPIEVGKDPIGIAAGSGAVWTANFRAGTVSRIEP